MQMTWKMTEMSDPVRGEVWLVDLNPARGHEQAGVRPALVVSQDLFNRGPAGLVVIIPFTTKEEHVPLHVKVDPPEGGLKAVSFIKCEDVRSAAKERLRTRLGVVGHKTLTAVEYRLRVLLGL